MKIKNYVEFQGKIKTIYPIKLNSGKSTLSFILDCEGARPYINSYNTIADYIYANAKEGMNMLVIGHMIHYKSKSGVYTVAFVADESRIIKED
jgi:hypothetical protein